MCPCVCVRLPCVYVAQNKDNCLAWSGHNKLPSQFASSQVESRHTQKNNGPKWQPDALPAEQVPPVQCRVSDPVPVAVAVSLSQFRSPLQQPLYLPLAFARSQFAQRLKGPINIDVVACILQTCLYQSRPDQARRWLAACLLACPPAGPNMRRSRCQIRRAGQGSSHTGLARGLMR